MIQAWHELQKLDDSLKEAATKRLKQRERKSGKPYVIRTYESLLSASQYIRDYGHLLNSEQVETYIVRDFSDSEKTLLSALLKAKNDEDYQAIHRKTRSECLRSRRAIHAVMEEVLAEEQERLKQQKKGFFGRFKK